MPDGGSPWDDIFSIAAPAEPEPPRRPERFAVYREAFERNGLHGFNIAYLEYAHHLPAPAQATATPRALVEWLRDPGVNARIRWPQDLIRASSEAGSSDEIDWIAQESQWLWAARLRPHDTTDDPIVEIVEPPEGHSPQRMLGRMTLCELTTRILYREHDWAGALIDSTGHGLDHIGLAARMLEPMTLGHQMRASWAGFGLGSYWYCTFFGQSIRLHTDDPTRIANEFADDEHLTWVPRS